MLHIKSVHHVEEFRIWVSFDDGIAGEIDLANNLNGVMFEPLKKIDEFKKVSIDPELETIVWPNGADLAPEFLRDLFKRQASNEKRT
jgi:hypothetical protein